MAKNITYNESMIISFNYVQGDIPVLLIANSTGNATTVLAGHHGQDALDIYRALSDKPVCENVRNVDDCLVCIFENTICTDGLFLITRKIPGEGVVPVNTIKGQAAYDLYNKIMKEG